MQAAIVDNNSSHDDSLFLSFISWVHDELRDEVRQMVDVEAKSDEIVTPNRLHAKVHKSKRKTVQKDEQPAALKWFVFKDFSKSDALLHFPKTFARLSNSGEGPKLGKLINAYCAKECKIYLAKNVPITVPQFMHMLDVSDLLFPDNVLVMHTTEILDHEIRALFYFKYTDAHMLHTFADVVVRDPFLKLLFVGARATVLPKMLNLQVRSEQTQRAVTACLVQQLDIQIYGCINWKITLDPHSKKFVAFEHFWRYTEINCEGERYKL